MIKGGPHAAVDAMAIVYQSMRRRTALSDCLEQYKHLKGTLNCAVPNFSPTMKPLTDIKGALRVNNLQVCFANNKHI